MEHILSSSGELQFGSYLAFLDSIKDRLPPHVHAFASDSRYYGVDSPSSLHDAWLETLTLREVASGERHEIRPLEIRLVFLGPMHDRRIHLHYRAVTRYLFTFEGPARPPVSHGDLITHEIRLGKKGLIHELLFEPGPAGRGATLLIECSDLRHSEEMIP